MSIFRRLFGKTMPREAMRPLYNAVVTRGREPHWYAQGGVPDTLDARFDMIAAILSFVLLRLEGESDAKQQSVWLTEIFVDDMDGQLRQIGIGDMIVGKHIGRMMGALGGRLTAYRAALAGTEPLEGVLVRNLFRGDPPQGADLQHVTDHLTSFWGALRATPAEVLMEGRLP